MAITVIHDERRKWLVARASGSLSIDDVTGFLRTGRAPIEARMLPLLVDARSCPTSMQEDDVESAVAIVRDIVLQKQRRGHVAIVADDETLYRWFRLYERKCAEAGAAVIRVFKVLEDAERWLTTVSGARDLA